MMQLEPHCPVNSYLLITYCLILDDSRNRLTDIMFEHMLVAKLNGDLM